MRLGDVPAPGQPVPGGDEGRGVAAGRPADPSGAALGLERGGELEDPVAGPGLGEPAPTSAARAEEAGSSGRAGGTTTAITASPVDMRAA